MLKHLWPIVTVGLFGGGVDMAKIDPVRSSHDYEEIDPKYHNDNDCPHCHELVRNHHVAEGKGGHPLCDWCASH